MTTLDGGLKTDLINYSRALDEVYRLRTALAVEASITAAHLDLKSFPKSRRTFAEQQVERMRAAARGDKDSHREFYDRADRQAREDAGMGQCLTAHSFELEFADPETRAKYEAQQLALQAEVEDWMGPRG